MQVAQFNVYNLIISNVIPALMQFYAGAWADLFGRKIMMFVYLASMVMGGVIALFSEIFVTAPKEWTLLISIPTSLVGGFPVWILSQFSFVADISEPKQRAVRMIMLDLLGAWGAPPGPYLGALIFNFGNRIFENGT